MVWYARFDRAVNEEKRWAEYLFKNGSMIGLNDKLRSISMSNGLQTADSKQLVSNQCRIKLPRTILLALDTTLDLLRVCSVAPQETEVESYVVGGIKQDVKKDTFAGFSL